MAVTQTDVDLLLFSSLMAKKCFPKCVVDINSNISISVLDCAQLIKHHPVIRSRTVVAAEDMCGAMRWSIFWSRGTCSVCASLFIHLYFTLAFISNHIIDVMIFSACFLIFFFQYNAATESYTKRHTRGAQKEEDVYLKGACFLYRMMYSFFFKKKIMKTFLLSLWVPFTACVIVQMYLHMFLRTYVTICLWSHCSPLFFRWDVLCNVYIHFLFSFLPSELLMCIWTSLHSQSFHLWSHRGAHSIPLLNFCYEIIYNIQSLLLRSHIKTQSICRCERLHSRLSQSFRLWSLRSAHYQRRPLVDVRRSLPLLYYYV